MKKLTFSLLSFGVFALSACGPQAKNNATVASQPAVTTPSAPSPNIPAQQTEPPIAPPPQKAETPVVVPTPRSTPTPQRTPTPRPQPRQHPATAPHAQTPVPRAKPQVNSDFSNNVRRITLTVNDRNLAEKVLFKKSERISGTLADGRFLSSDKVVESLKKGKTVCVFVSENNNFPNNDETLKSIKVAERLSLTRANLPLRQIEAVFAWKDQFYSLHCEKKGNFKTADITTALGSSFDIQFLMQ